jgi:hypothetical protein
MVKIYRERVPNLHDVPVRVFPGEEYFRETINFIQSFEQETSEASSVAAERRSATVS